MKEQAVFSVKPRSVLPAELEVVSWWGGAFLTKSRTILLLIIWKFLTLRLQPNLKRERIFLMKKHADYEDFLLLTTPLSVRDRQPHGEMKSTFKT